MTKAKVAQKVRRWLRDHPCCCQSSTEWQAHLFSLWGKKVLYKLGEQTCIDLVRLNCAITKLLPETQWDAAEFCTALHFSKSKMSQERCCLRYVVKMQLHSCDLSLPASLLLKYAVSKWPEAQAEQREASERQHLAIPGSTLCASCGYCQERIHITGSTWRWWKCVCEPMTFNNN